MLGDCVLYYQIKGGIVDFAATLSSYIKILFLPFCFLLLIIYMTEQSKSNRLIGLD